MKKKLLTTLCMCVAACLCIVTPVEASSPKKTDVTNEEAKALLEQLSEEDVSINPFVVIESYEVENTNLQYGDETVLHLTLTNESKTTDIHELLISYASQNASIVPVYGQTNTVYVDQIEAGKSITLDIPIAILSSTSGYVQMEFQMQYTANMKVYSNNNNFIVFRISTADRDQIHLNDTDSIETETTVIGSTNDQANQTENTEQTQSETTTIVGIIGVIILLLALFGIVFGRKKK